MVFNGTIKGLKSVEREKCTSLCARSVYHPTNGIFTEAYPHWMLFGCLLNPVGE